jgi:hypothetical protein
MGKSEHSLLMCRAKKRERGNGKVLKRKAVENFNLYVSFSKT